MYRIFMFSILALYVTMPAQQPAAYSSRVTAATVYRGMAIISRQAEVSLQPGQNQIVLTNLPNAIDSRTIRIKPVNANEVRITDNRVSEINTTEIQQADSRAITKKIASLREQIEQCDDKIAVLNSKREVIELIKVSNPVNTPDKIKHPAVSIKEWGTVTGFVESSLSEILKGIHTLVVKKQELENEIIALNKQIAENRLNLSQKYKNVTLTAISPRARKAILEVTYTNPKASWNPAYDSYVNAADKKADVFYYAMVQQSTGEDWENIQLSLSTADPMTSNFMPVHSRWDLMPKTELHVRGGRGSETVIMLDKESIVEASTEALSTVFSIKEPANIPSDNSMHQVTITRENIPVTLQYLALPRVSTGVYLQGKFVNPLSYPMLKGNMNVYVDYDYSNKIAIPFTVSQDTLAMQLGADNKLFCEKVLVERVSEKTGLLKGGREVRYSFKIKLANHRNEAVQIELLDQIPVSRQENIVVELTEPQKKTDEKPADGILKWNIRLAPGESVEIPVKYSVQFPKDVTVYGLE